ncbi:MAG: hypothetical protein KDD22_06515 [Bdellovibrionales bacterium]|nr:hypothetical protein [Bdellovibrionales bacterium]
MRIHFVAPSKTFLIGEYAVLEGGQGVLVATEPNFEMTIESPGHGSVEGISLDSPAGRWIRSHSEFFRKVRLKFTDPHEGAGGFGASSAQFLFVNLWTQMQKQNLASSFESLDIEQVWQDFRKLHENDKGSLPSGGDLISQWEGGLSSFSANPYFVKNLKWNFKNLHFSLFHTGYKIATHQHLANLETANFGDLVRMSERAVQSIEQSDEANFLSLVRSYSLELEYLGLLALNTQDILTKFKGNNSILASKGCGALGADVIAVYHRPEERVAIRSFAENMGLRFIAGVEEVQKGLKISIDTEDSSQGVPVDL